MSVDDESVRDFLRRRGAAEHLVEGGLAAMVEAWERVAEGVAGGYALGLDDYLNDLDLRQLLEEALGAANDLERARTAPRLAAADARMRGATVPARRCLWGDDVARYHGWDAERNWWYYRVPRDAGPELGEDLNRD
jgi:hypothetical protein